MSAVDVTSSIPLAIWVWRGLLIMALYLAVIETRKKWIGYVQSEYVNNLKWTMLYVKIPRDTRRSPFAMEMILNVLWQTGKTGSWRDLFWSGQVRPYHTLELVSIEGKVYYFFRVYSEFVDFVKTQIYAQYPETEIYVVDDYTKYVPKFVAGKGEWNVQGTELKLEKDDLLPIKTYIDYGLDKAGKAEERIDPLSNVIEVLASLGPGEQYWIQFHIRAAATNRDIPGQPFKKQSWQDAARGAITKFEASVKTDIEKRSGTGKKFEEIYPDLAKKMPQDYMTEQQKIIYNALDRHLSKNAFDVGIRCLYVAKKDVFRGSVHNSMSQVWRIFNAPGMNSIGGNNDVNTVAAADHPWEDPFGHGGDARRNNIYNAYVARSYFYGPFDEWPDTKPHNKPRSILLLTTEELATLFHFPGAEVTSGGLSRVEARKAEAPANLPTF